MCSQDLAKNESLVTWQEYFQWNEKMYTSVKWERMKDLKLVLSLQWLFPAISGIVCIPWSEWGIIKKGKKSKNPSNTREDTIIGKKTEMGRDKTSLQT